MIAPLLFLLISLGGLGWLFYLKLSQVEQGQPTILSKWSADLDPKIVAFESDLARRVSAWDWRQAILFVFKILEKFGHGLVSIWRSVLPSYHALHEHLRGKKNFKTTRATSVFLKDVSEHKNSLPHDTDNLPRI